MVLQTSTPEGTAGGDRACVLVRDRNGAREPSPTLLVSATRACRAGIARAAFLPPLSLKAVDPPVLCRLPCTWPGVPRGETLCENPV